MRTDHLKLIHSDEPVPERPECPGREARRGNADPLAILLPLGIAFASAVWLAAIYGTFRFFLG